MPHEKRLRCYFQFASIPQRTDTEQEILAVFHDYHRQGTTFVVVTHNVHLADSQESPRILHMRKGVLTKEKPAHTRAA